MWRSAPYTGDHTFTKTVHLHVAICCLFECVCANVGRDKCSVLSTIDCLKDLNCCRCVLSGRDSREGVFVLNYIFSLVTVCFRVIIIVWKRLADENLMKPCAINVLFGCDPISDTVCCLVLCSLRI